MDNNLKKASISITEDGNKKQRQQFLTPAPAIKNEGLDEYQNKIKEMTEQARGLEKTKEQFLRGPSSSSYLNANSYFDLGHSSSTILGGPAFFGNPMSPAYPNTASINYYNVSNMNDISLLHCNNNVINLNPPVNNINNNNQNLNSNCIFSDSKMEITETNTVSQKIQQGNFVSNPLGYPSDILPKLQNIVSTANLKCLLNLREIALRAKNAEYNPKRFAAVIMRIKEPKTTALIFASGKMVCTGARSEEDSRKAARQYAKIIHKLGNPVKFSEFKIQNIVGSCDVKFQIRLEGLSSFDSKSCSYEPEVFPGLIFRMIQPKIVLLIFVSGKIVLTGAKERNEIFEAFHNILPLLQKFKKKDASTSSQISELSVLQESQK